MMMEEAMLHIVDSEHKTAPQQEEGYPYVKTSDIENGRILLEETDGVSQEVYEEWTQRLKPEPGDLILTREAPVGRVGIIPPREQVCLGQRTVLLRPDPEILDSRYLLYLLLTEEIQHRFEALSAGSTVPHLNLSDLREFELPDLPPLEVQKEIGECLGAFDEKMNLNRDMNPVLEETARTVFEVWFQDFTPFDHFKKTELGEIPEGWRVGTLGELMEKITDRVDPTELPDSTPYIGLKDMPEESVALKNWRRAEEISSTKYRFERGQILFGRLRPYFCKVGIAPTSGVSSTDIQVVVPKEEEFWREFLVCQLSDQTFIDYCEKVSTGTRMPRVGWDDMCEYSIPIPPEDVAEDFSRITRPLFQKIIANIHESIYLEQMRDALLPRLMDGDLRANDIKEEDKSLLEEV